MRGRSFRRAMAAKFARRDRRVTRRPRGGRCHCERCHGDLLHSRRRGLLAAGGRPVRIANYL